MKHKHYDMIVAKAANMDLVVFYRLPNEEWWQKDSECEALPDDIDFDYFLCLPQHKEAVLNCLNGGESQVASISSGWLPANCGDPVEWGGEWWYMNPNGESRIKPKKEKRWMIYSERPLSIEIFSDESVCDTVFSSKLPTENKQKIEIEVEV